MPVYARPAQETNGRLEAQPRPLSTPHRSICSAPPGPPLLRPGRVIRLRTGELATALSVRLTLPAMIVTMMANTVDAAAQAMSSFGPIFLEIHSCRSFITKVAKRISLDKLADVIEIALSACLSFQNSTDLCNRFKQSKISSRDIGVGVGTSSLTLRRLLAEAVPAATRTSGGCLHKPSYRAHSSPRLWGFADAARLCKDPLRLAAPASIVIGQVRCLLVNLDDGGLDVWRTSWYFSSTFIIR